MSLTTWEQCGWNGRWQEVWAEWLQRYTGSVDVLAPARVIEEQRGRCRIVTPFGARQAVVSGSLRHHALGRRDFPAVGDFVAIASPLAEQVSPDARAAAAADRPDNAGEAVIHGVLPRASLFSRKRAGDVTEEQLIAANVDVAFIVQSSQGDFNARRLERYLVLVWESGAQPMVVLSKADLCADVASLVREAEQVAVGVPVYAVSAELGDGVHLLRAQLTAGRTGVFIGSSGVGKSTLVNALVGADVLATAAVRADDNRGRHTTTHRQMVPVPGGGVVIDTPGMRELQLWEAPDGMSAAFADVESWARQCRFADCEHKTEPGCAVQAAVSTGELAADRLDSYAKLQRELAYLARRESQRLLADERQKWKQAGKAGEQSRALKRGWPGGGQR